MRTSSEIAKDEEILFLRGQLEKTLDELIKEREHSRSMTGQLMERANPPSVFLRLFKRK